MHEAYEVSHLLNVTVQIEAIAAYGKYFRVGACILWDNTHYYKMTCIKVSQDTHVG